MELEAAYQEAIKDNVFWALDNFKVLTTQYHKFHKLRKALDEQITKLQKINLNQQKIERNQVVAKNYINSNIQQVEQNHTNLEQLKNAIDNKCIDTQTSTYFSKDLNLFKNDLHHFLLNTQKADNIETHVVLFQKFQKLFSIKQNSPIEIQRQQFEEIFYYVKTTLRQATSGFFRGVFSQINCVEDFCQAHHVIDRIIPLLEYLNKDDYNKLSLENQFGELITKIYVKRDLKSIEKAANNYGYQFKDFLAYCQCLKKSKSKFSVPGSVLDFILTMNKESIKESFKQDIKPFLLTKRELNEDGTGLVEFLDISLNKSQCEDLSATSWIGRVYIQLQKKFYNDVQIIAQFATKLFCGMGFKSADWYIGMLQQQCQISNILYQKLTYNNLLFCIMQSNSSQYINRMKQIIQQIAQSYDYSNDFKEQVLTILLFNTKKCLYNLNQQNYERLEQFITNQITQINGQTGVCE